MNRTREESASLEVQLGILAMQFRGTTDDAKRGDIQVQYAQTVSELVGSGNWDEIPPLEDQLPDKFMPAEFFEKWLRISPKRRASKRTG